MAAVITAAIAAPLTALFLFNPETTRVFPPCPLHWLTGLHCPGCGSLRAMHCLLHGRIYEALSQNPLMVVSIPVIGIMFASPAWIYRRWVPWVALLVLTAYGLARNISLWPFVLLAP